MRLVVTENISLDGVVEQNDQTGEWFSFAGSDADTSDINQALQEMMSQEDAQLYGRKTFEAMRGFWPNQTNDKTGVTAHLNTVEKYVLSSTLNDPEWENATVLHGDLLDEVRMLKDQPGGNLGVTGSISVCHTLIIAGVVDEYRLLVYPVLVGQGRRLFEPGQAAATVKMNLKGTTQFRSGVVLVTYEPA
jgi:dihydrofolate reductase